MPPRHAFAIDYPHRAAYRVCRWSGCNNRIRVTEVTCFKHKSIEMRQRMDICKEAFETWYAMSVGDDMDIATSIAWDNWRAAWCAAHAALNNGKTRDLAYERTVSIWLTAGASDREKFAYRDGHDRGWRNAVEAIAIRKEA